MDDVQLRQPFAFLAHRLFPFFQDRPTRSPFKRYTPKRGRHRLCHSPPMGKAVGTGNHVVARASSDMLLTCTTSQLGLILACLRPSYRTLAVPTPRLSFSLAEARRLVCCRIR